MGVKLGCAAAVGLVVLAIVGAVLFYANKPPATPPAPKAGTRARDLGSAAYGVTDLEGIWQQVNGDKDWQFEFRRYTLMERTGSLRVEKRRSPFSLRTAATPKQIDWGDGTVFGIYRLDGPEELTLCFKSGASPADRPQAFAAEGGDVRLYTFKRVGR